MRARRGNEVETQAQADMDFAGRLRQEIEQGQARRHEYSLRKMGFSTGLLGVGALNVPFSGGQLDLSPLLWLVPLVALGFDLYIVAEDFGVKRAGAFLRLPESGASEAEQNWESVFVVEHSSPFAALAFFLVTLIVMVAALALLIEVGAKPALLAAWVTVLVGSEVGLLIYSLRLRRKFDVIQESEQLT